jgi:hypothetical protein
MQQLETPSPVAARIFDLPADFAHGLSLPIDRRQAPAGMTGNAPEGRLPAHQNVDVAVQVAGATRVARYAAAVGSARGRRGMRMHVVALGGIVACRMAVHAPRIHARRRGRANVFACRQYWRRRKAHAARRGSVPESWLSPPLKVQTHKAMSSMEPDEPRPGAGRHVSRRRNVSG